MRSALCRWLVMLTSIQLAASTTGCAVGEVVARAAINAAFHGVVYAAARGGGHAGPPIDDRSVAATHLDRVHSAGVQAIRCPRAEIARWRADGRYEFEGCGRRFVLECDRGLSGDYECFEPTSSMTEDEGPP